MPLIIPVFIGHRGCPHRCLFCDQQAIAGGDSFPDVAAEIETWLARSQKHPAQLAFYGGSFTCLPWAEQEKLLAQARPYLADGRIATIRVSTRPDCCGQDNLFRLRDWGVTTVELGVQSLDELVLALSRRGHTTDDTRQAIATIKRLGFVCGVQLLPGLPGESWPSFLATIRETIALRPAMVRLYPALVLAGTGLADLYAAGLYRPLSLTTTVAWLARAKRLFDAAGIEVIRYGLPPSTELAPAVLAGPYHPALGEMAAQRLWFLELRRRLSALTTGQILTIFVSPRDRSRLSGQRRGNLLRLEQLGLRRRLHIVTESWRSKGSVEYVVN
ncbi:MAG TPA: radical SAM protein [Desulfobulbaceae bacterium]|nr:radical SAM protein [Desulfobulbaceae bacterium]